MHKWTILFLIYTWHASAQIPYIQLENQAKFTSEERKLITSGDTSKMMRILQTPDREDLQLLRTVSTDIATNDPLLPLLAQRMYLSVTDSSAGGVGIAAPQVGINRNLIWVKRFDKPGEPFEFYINPKFTWKSDLQQWGPEGCLSIPDMRENVIRSYAVQVSYATLDGKFLTEVVEGFTAVIFQHEMDHLYGILFPDRLEEQEKQAFISPADRGKHLLYDRTNRKRM